MKFDQRLSCIIDGDYRAFYVHLFTTTSKMSLMFQFFGKRFHSKFNTIVRKSYGNIRIATNNSLSIQNSVKEESFIDLNKYVLF